ncbi:MAG: recombinase family protein, partial [Oscillospiraceae bacterium]|nr:recombinase family protein [Oscillospiraceae bacterium]
MIRHSRTVSRKVIIITKSVSRFARNTVDSLETTRKLKAAGVEIYFE